ncbi:hypothetical protein C8R46DRAFT_877855 [Mycena filopes]|nr:hypothetical protein C8R46DRAFT_877855 [Mycena filopes]
MGRRKIEIQPILHERNRSVTFLKRKNGLFKKAYELGVLCSVDVAVIIFGATPFDNFPTEQRPGHNVKLYQYCSGDVQNIVQRHIGFDGEKDTRGPSDFSGNAAAKVEDCRRRRRRRAGRRGRGAPLTRFQASQRRLKACFQPRFGY